MVVLDIRTQVVGNGDRGLLGLALHPSYPTVPYVYVLFTYYEGVAEGSFVTDADGYPAYYDIELTVTDGNTTYVATYGSAGAGRRRITE